MIRNPKCALCQNHGNVVGTKFHKRYCPWKECPCQKCEYIKYRRKLLAAQIADRRKMIEDKDREKTPESKRPRRIKTADSSVAAPPPPPPRVPIKPTAFRPAPVQVPSAPFQGPYYIIPVTQPNSWHAPPSSRLSAGGYESSPWALAEDNLRQYSVNHAVHTNNLPYPTSHQVPNLNLL